MLRCRSSASTMAFLLVIAALLLLTTSSPVNSHPTMYKLNENLKLEPDLVAVSSTVIPLPIYKVGYGVDVAKGGRGKKVTLQRPEGPVTLITALKKKPVKDDS